MKPKYIWDQVLLWKLWDYILIWYDEIFLFWYSVYVLVYSEKIYLFNTTNKPDKKDFEKAIKYINENILYIQQTIKNTETNRKLYYSSVSLELLKLE